MQEADPEAIRAYMKKTGISQTELAVRAGVSQATVSRALAKRPERSGKAWRKLCTFIHQLPAAAAGPGQGAVLQAFGRIWDGSEVHAEAIARVIDALEGLRPIHR